MSFRSRAGRFSQVLLVGALMAALAACGSDGDDSGPEGSGSTATGWDKVLADAEEEGSVTFYTPVAEVTVDKWKQAFEKAYPRIKMTVYRADQPTITARLAAEGQSGTATADAVVNGIDGPTTTLGGFDEEDKLTGLEGPNFQEADVAAAKVTENRYYVAANVLGWAWNTDLVPDGIKAWEDLLDPKLANGKIGTYDAALSPLVPAWFNAQTEASGDPDWFEHFAAQKPRIYPGTTVQENAVAAGELAMTPFSTNNILALKEKGAPIEWAVPPEGAGVAGLELAVMKNAPHPAAAQVLANWLMSVEAQEINLATGATPARANIPGNEVDFASLEVTVPVSGDEHQAFIKTFNSLFQK